MDRNALTQNCILQFDMIRVRSGIIEPLPKLFYELRYSPDQPRDEHGRFTFGNGGGSSGKSVDKIVKPDIMKTGLKISMQYFGKKRAGIWLPKKEYGKIKHEINTEYYNKYDGKDVFVHRSVYNNTYYDYRVRNYGFDNYVFVARSRAK